MLNISKTAKANPVEFAGVLGQVIMTAEHIVGILSNGYEVNQEWNNTLIELKKEFTEQKKSLLKNESFWNLVLSKYGKSTVTLLAQLNAYVAIKN